MLKSNWIQSPTLIDPSKTAQKQVWLAVLEASQPTLMERLLRHISWLFATPVRTAVFATCLFVVVLGSGYYLPTYLEHQRWDAEETQLNQEFSTLEQEISAELTLQ